MLAARVCLDHESDEPDPLVNYGRPGEPLPQRGTLRNADVDIEGNKTVRITRGTGRKQPTCHLLAVSQAGRPGFSIRKPHRDALDGPFARPRQAGQASFGTIPGLLRARGDLKQD